MKKRGGITIFLTLILSVISAFIITLAVISGRYISKSEAVYAMDNAVRSCFAEYNRELYDRYHILLIDSSYKGYEKGKDRIEDHFAMYLENGISENELCRAQISEEENAAESNNGYLYEAGVDYARKTGNIDGRFSGTGDDAYFLAYLWDVCGNRDSIRENSCRTGEIEYLLYGFDSDDENIRLAGEDYEESEGMTYDEYLSSRLEEEGILLLRRRFGELISEYMQQNGSPGFDLDECYHKVTFTAILKGRGTGEYSVEREYSYDLSGI